MYDITGMALVSYMLRQTKDIVSRAPRFRRALGDVGLIAGNKIAFNNVQVIIRDITTGSERLSMDNYMSTTRGRAILSKVIGKDGTFIEWMDETDATMQTPLTGVYCFNVDAVDEDTRKVDFTVETFKWYQGKITNAQGSKLVFASGIVPADVILKDGVTDATLGFFAGGNYAFLQSNATTVIATYNGGALTPMVDYWVERVSTQSILTPTIFGTQSANLPAGMAVSQITDQDDYVLRSGTDYIYTAADQILLSAWTPSGATISATGIVKLDPTHPGNAINPENFLGFTLAPGEAIATAKMFVATQDGTGIVITANPDGTAQLPAPLPQGGWCRYDLRVLVGQSKMTGVKNAVNKDMLPGLRIAIGDQVTEGDQCAILVSPCITETYRVYGGKPSINFTLEVRANDPTTADEIAKLLKKEFLYDRYENMDADGLTLLEAGTSFLHGVRDLSGTAPAYSSSLNFSGFADWRVYEPLVTRVLDFTITVVPQMSTSFKGLSRAGRWGAFGLSGFMPDYS